MRPLARKLSYLCIQMNYTMEDLKNIKLTQTFMEFILHYLYFVFLKYLYFYKKIYTIGKREFILLDNGIKIDTSFIPYEYIVNCNDDNGYINLVLLKYLYFYKKIYTIGKREFILLDNGIKIDTSFIPYEYIVNCNDDNGYINLVLLAKIEEGQLVPFDAIFHFSFKSNCNSSIIKNIKSNLYYHIKYNHINLDILSYNSVKIYL